MELCLITLLLSVTWTVTLGDRGIIVTAPDTWQVNSEEKICVSFHDIDFNVMVEAKVILSYPEGNSPSYTKTYTFTQGQAGCFSMSLPRGDFTHRVKLYVSAWDTSTDGKSYMFNQNKSISILDVSTSVNVTFIETDKPVYKPGDKVQMRFLTIKENLRPRTERYPLVMIQNPLGIRVMQWRDISVASQQGLAHLSFDLSPDTKLGTWKITVMRADGNKHSQTFTVEKYVLPKFEVQVKPQDYIPVWADKVNAQICARYTYGQPVKGNLTIRSCVKKQYGYVEVPCFEEKVQIKGCYNLSYPLQDFLEPLTSFYGGIYFSINATVAEEGTDSKVTTCADTTRLGLKKYQIQFTDTHQYFRPGLDFSGKVTVTDSTGGSVEGLKVLVSVDNTVQEEPSYKAYTDSTGSINFTFSGLELSKNSDYFMFRARLLKEEDFGAYSSMIQRPQIMKTVKVWYSPTNSAIVISTLTDVVKCGGIVHAEVSLSGEHLKSRHFFYQVIVQNKIVQQATEGNKENQHFQGNKLSFMIKLPSAVWGEASLLVYAISGETEVLADSKTFKIKHCIENEISLEFNQPVYRPGEDVVMSLTAGPGSLCAYGITDKSVRLLGGSNAVTMDMITDKIPVKSRNMYYESQDDYCENVGKLQEEDQDDILLRRRSRNGRRMPRMIVPFPGQWRSRFVDSSQAFRMSHLTVFSDLSVDTRPCHKRLVVTYLAYDLSPGLRVYRKMSSHVVPGNVLYDSEPLVVDTVRSFFPETWLWDIIPVGPDGTAEVIDKAPDTITEWIGHAVCTSEEHGLGISNSTKFKTFQPFFISVNLPYSAVRGETLLLPVSVFNYLPECLVISLEVLESTNYTVDGNRRQELCVCEQKSSHHFPITAKALGHINITIIGESVKNAIICGNVIVSSMIGVRDTVIREMLVEPEGKEEESAHSSLMCPTTGGIIEEHQQWTVPSDVVADSLRTHITVIGDVMGPALSGLESLLRLPTGCGEQNMIKFAPNIYVLQYLTNTHELNKEMEEKAVKYLHTGYERELQYRHSDGSYSAFGQSDDSGSTWLTAFVLKSFSQAAHFINIDEMDLKMTHDWFEKNQLENGCFRSMGRVIHKSMKGGLSNSQESLAPLTAYSLVALLEAGYDTQSHFILDAVSCLSAQQYTDSYSAALVTYAYSLLGRDSVLAQIAMEKLNQFKRELNGMVFWTADNSDLTETKPVVRAIDIEITAYALLAHLQMSPDPLNDLDIILPIVRWLTAQRNPNGGFLSTQDTVVALQALAEFAEIVKSELGDTDVNVKVNNEEHSFKINVDNHLLLQKQSLLAALEPEQQVDIFMKANGTGCSFVQTSMKYNVLNVTSGSTHNIHLDVTVSRTPKNICYRRLISVCIRYDGPDDATNMALLDVKMVTGWTPVEATVEKLLQDPVLHIARYEVQKKNVNIYFNELARGENICLSFEVNQDIEVRNAKPGTATIYDYYDQQEVFYQKEYTLRSICGTKEELPLISVDPKSLEDHVGQARLPAGEFPHLRNEITVIEETPCPHCYEEDPDTDDLRDVLCSASHVYRGMVKNSGTIKLHKDLVHKRKINKLTSVISAPHCSCPLLNSKKQWVWIISPGTEVEEISTRKAKMTLNATDTVIPIKQKSKALDRLLKRVKRSKQCSDSVAS